MANTKLGLPQITITFASQASTSIARSARGVGSLIFNDSNVTDEDGVKYCLVEDSTDIPSGIDDGNADLIQKALLGTPNKLHCYFIPPATHEEEQEQERVVENQVESDVVVTNSDTGETETVTSTVTVTDTVTETVTVTVDATVTQADALRKCADVRFNYIAHPTGSTQDQQNLASWLRTQRGKRDKTVKAVVPHYDGDSFGIINFTTDKIRINNPAYRDALALVDGDATAVDPTIPQYITYNASQYTARIVGILAGLGLDRSATYYTLSEVVDVAEYDDIDEHINKGELCLFDEKDGNGVKIARGCNSLHTFTSATGYDFRFIKVVETVDLIKDDIRDTFRNQYVGKVANNYDNKMLFVAAINSYLLSLQGNVLDRTSTDTNYVEIDYDKNYEYAKQKGADVADMSEQAILEYQTGTNVFLRGKIRPVNAMEDLTLAFVLN